MNQIPAQLLLQVVLILLNAFFAMTEIAVISLNSTKLKKDAEAGDKKAKKLLKMVEEPNRFLSTIQIAITLSGFLGSAFAADNFSGYLVDWIHDDLNFTAIPVGALDTLALIVITLIISYFTLVLGELVPKRIAMQKPMQVARITCGVVSFVALITKPIVWFLSVSTNAVLRALKMKTDAEEEAVTEEEIRMMVESGEESGAIDKEEKEWIENVFDFGDSTVRECMTHLSEVVAIAVNTGKDEIMKLIKSTGLSRFPVYHKDIHDVFGVLYARDFLIAMSSGENVSLEMLVRPTHFVPETVRSSIAFRDMQARKMHLSVVVDEYGDVSGIVTLEDLLEEIVGNIYDEFDEPEPAEIKQVAENLWKASGSVPMDEIESMLDIKFPDDLDFDTLNGMVYYCLSAIPNDGVELDIEDFGIHVHVKRIVNRRVEEADIWKVEPAEESEENEESK